jgi:ferrous iron transport protein A
MLKNPVMLKPGEKGTITSLNESIFYFKLLELGFLPGKVIRLIRRAPGGSPLYFDLQGHYVALRKEEAESILLEIEK